MTTDFRAFALQPDLMRAIEALGYEVPTPIQEKAIPALLSGDDVLGQAQTGTGKTAAFALPMLQALEAGGASVQGLIVTPTRELALQVARAVYEYGRYANVRVLAVYGGQPYSRQISRLRQGVDVVVGTPGRLLDLIRKSVLDLGSVRYLVLDEADEMLSMGFIEDIEAILEATPAARQTALFSATLPEPIRRLASRYLRNPQAIAVATEHLTVDQTEQRAYLVYEEDKAAALHRLLELEPITRALIFASTKVRVAELAEALLARGVQAEALHGDLSQAAREVVLSRFRRGQITTLVATDVAARGLDIESVSHVINYDVPFDPEAYVHRIGRTGRAGKEGVAITLLTPRERRYLKVIETFTRKPVTLAQVPSVQDVLDQREARFAAHLREELQRESDARAEAPGLDLVARLCASGYTPAEVAAAAIRLARAGERQQPLDTVREVQQAPLRRPARRPATPREARPRRDKRQSEAGMVRLLMSVGSAQGIRPGDVVGAIASEAGIPGRAIGAIDIQQQRTFVDVMERHAEHVLRKMHRCRLRGHAATLNPAD